MLNSAGEAWGEEMCTVAIESGQLSPQDGRWQRPPNLSSAYARVLLNPMQHKMADEVELVWQTAVTAWEDGRVAEAAAQIQNGITRLRKLGTGFV